MSLDLLVDAFVNVFRPRMYLMDPLQMRSEVVRSWPSLPLSGTAFDGARISVALGIMGRMAASHVPVDVVRRAKALFTLAAGDGTAVGLLMSLFMLTAGKKEPESVKSREKTERGWHT